MRDRVTIEDMLEEALSGIDELKAKLQLMELLVPIPQTVNVKNIADIEGVSVSHISGKARYLLPRYGESAFPDGYRRWPLDEYLAWRKRPIEERIGGYGKLLEEIKDECIEHALEREEQRALKASEENTLSTT